MTVNIKNLKRIFALATWVIILWLVFIITTITYRDNASIHDWLYMNANVTPSPAEILKAEQLELPNVPFEFWQRFRTQQLNKTCAHAPSMKDLRFHNNYWQVFRNLDVTYRLFNAYFDERAHVTQLSAVVRVLLMMNQRPAPTNALYCQLWYDNMNQPVIVAVAEQRLIWYTRWHSGDHYPYLLSCAVPLPLRKFAPRAVSLVTRLCDTASNLLRVHNERPAGNETKHGFAVCVKGLDYPYVDMGPRLVEWLEMQRLLGARKVITYKLALQPNLEQVLQHYIAEGFLEVHPVSLGSDMVSAPHYLHDYLRANIWDKRLNELVPYNDCFYRNMNKYDYIAAVDVDEVIMPLGNLTSWQQLIDETWRQRPKKCPFGYASTCVRNVIFPLNGLNYTETSAAPRYMVLLQHVHRTVPEPPRHGVKCFHNTSEVLTLHNHYSIGKLKACDPFNIEPNVAQLQHYRMLQKPEEWVDPIPDDSIYRYKEALVRNVEPVLRKLGYLL